MLRALISAVLLFVPSVLTAQTITAIKGQVRSEDGAAIAGVQVTISSPALIEQTRQVRTDDTGQYFFLHLPVGIYTVSFEREGFTTVRVDDIHIDHESVMVLNRSLSPAISEFETILVGRAQIIDKQKSSLSRILSREMLQHTPSIQNNVFQLTSVFPGYTDHSGLGSVQVSGNVYELDGEDISDMKTGEPAVNVGLGAADQVAVGLFGANIFSDSFTGASLNVITRSGGNVLSGDLQYFFRQDNWGGGDDFDLQSGAPSFPVVGAITNPNASLGGPLSEEQIWFFANLNYLRGEIDRQLVDELLTTTDESAQYFGKLSGRWDDQHRSAVSLFYFDRAISHQLFEGDWFQNYQSSLHSASSDGLLLTAQHDFYLTRELNFFARYSYFQHTNELLPIHGDGENAPTLWSLTLNAHLPDSSANQKDVTEQSRHSFLLGAQFYTEDIGGVHYLTTGLECMTAVVDRDFSQTDYQYWQEGVPSLKIDFGAYQASTRFEQFSAYAHDSWTMDDQLIVNAGIRFDRTSAGANENELAINDPSEDFLSFEYFSPRIGLVYDVFGDGRTIFRASYGRYYEGVLTGETEPLVTSVAPTRQYLRSLDRWVLFDERGGSAAYQVDNDLKNQYTEGFSVGIERELTTEIIGSAAFVYKQDSDLIGLIEPNAGWDRISLNFQNQFGNYNGPAYINYNSGNLQILTNPEKGDNGVLEDPERKYRAIILELKKRFSDNWSLLASYTYSQAEGNVDQYRESIVGVYNFSNPNRWVNTYGRNVLDTPHVFKLSGSFLAPFDVMISPVFLYRSGYPFYPQYRVDIDTAVVIAEQDGENRLDDQILLDLRVEKFFTVSERYRLGLAVDIFNLFNNDAVTSLRSAEISSLDYAEPATILTPWYYQVGVRLSF